MEKTMDKDQRIVITGVGLTAPNGNNLTEFRSALLNGRSGISPYEIRYFGKTLAGICRFDAAKYQKKKDIRRGTRAGSIAVYCANEAVADSGIDWQNTDTSQVGVFIGITEHGNVETENEIYNIKQFNYDCSTWSHFHNPRTVANNPAGEVTLNMRITGPHYCLGAACAAGNAGLIQGVQMLRLGEVDFALAGGVSESIHTFGIFAAFAAENALAVHDDPAKASRPFDKNRSGIVISEGGCIFTLERLSDAQKRGAKIYGEIVGYGMNSDASDFVLPNPDRQAECMVKALKKACLEPEQIDLISTHATATSLGDIQEIEAVRKVFQSGGHASAGQKTYINNTKSFIGHAMGAVGCLELAGNLPSFSDGVIHPTINCEDLDPACEIDNLVIGTPKETGNVEYILNNSFGMVGINSVVIVKNPHC
ncbi:MAG: beta-ketoacyl-[acyl-carrier-protein] synthase family protein [Planctomycetaceae bacterium]|jgi:3-oxoacyl-[acyl-carrier-protein] synthase II|nr:beta-ketoacyl-[acyl-carrier-protein] synthase family protein [Planctomycetaceae bacterium]